MLEALTNAAQTWSLSAAVAIFVVAAVLTLWGGVWLSALGDVVADRTGWGEAVVGTVALGAATSLSGVVMTAAAAAGGHAQLAYSNAVGGVAAQTAALAAADVFYRRANLEHAAASLFNVLSGVILIALLVLSAALTFVPEVTVWHVHVGTPLLLIVYLKGLAVSRGVRAEPLWHPERTPQTRQDVPEPDAGSRSTRRVALLFAGFAVLVSVAGWAIAQASVVLSEQTGLSETQVGTLLMGITNALPETVVAIAAVRHGALTLAVAGILGGNAFDVLNLAVGDVAYRGGSLYHTATDEQLLVLFATMFMTAMIVAGLLRRERHGPGGIGLESTLVLVVYAAAALLVAVGATR